MKSYIQSILTIGSAGIIIEIECQLSNSLPSIVIVGLGSKAVDEAKERIRSAFTSSELSLPRKRIIINLAPADIPKESTSLDLAIAAAILTANKQTKIPLSKNHAIIGEVGLTGTVRPVRGIIGKLLAAQKLGVTTIFIPVGNLNQARLVPGITIIPIATIKDLSAILHGDDRPTAHDTGFRSPVYALQTGANSFSAIAGQEQAKRALQIAAAGGHNILLYGPPGTGKSMLAKALPTIMPPLDHHEILEITHLHSLADSNYDVLVTDRPFRAPHHSSSHVSIVGGGAQTRPGEVTLSHRGILFLDEMPEFNRLTREALRQPLEDGVITVARAKLTVEYPADFLLIATANPCPCGFYGSDKTCQCTPYEVLRYQQKLSGPILDRIDMYVEVSTVDHDQLLKSTADHNYDEKVRSHVLLARKAQKKRLQVNRLNARMSNDDIKKYARLSLEARELLNNAAKKLALSARAYMRIIKVSRTIADLEQSDTISASHISEALRYRSLHFQNQ